jgi:hypothetical protein
MKATCPMRSSVRRIFCTIAILSCTVSALSAITTEDIYRGLRSALTVQPATVSPGDDPEVTYTVTNGSNDTVAIIVGPTVIEFSLNVFDGTGHRLAVHPVFPIDLTRRTRHLGPGDIYSSSGHLSQWGLHLGPGHYRLVAQRMPFTSARTNLSASTTIVVK